MAAVCAGAMLLALGGCGNSSAGQTPAESVPPSAAQPTREVLPTGDEYDAGSASFITFSDNGIEIVPADGTEAEAEGTALTIKSGGTYVLTGTCADGSVKVKKGVTGVTMVLSGLNLTSADTAPITCAKSSGVSILAAAGTVNTLADAPRNNDDEYPDNENAENAVIKCKDGSRVVLCGAGQLRIQANGKNGIKSGQTTDEEGEASLVIRTLTLEIDAMVNDAINAEQSLAIESGHITISAGDDAVHSDLALSVGAEGTAGPTIVVKTCSEGLEGANLSICSGDITIYAEDDCLNAANSDLGNYAFTLSISGGSLAMESADGDGIDSNGTLTISGGTVVVWTANTADNQPLDADGEITISGGTVLAAGGSAGMGMNLLAQQPYVVFGSAAMGGFGGGGMMGAAPEGVSPSDRGEVPGEPRGDQPEPPEQPAGVEQFGKPDLPNGGDAPFGSMGGAAILQAGAFSICDGTGAALYTGEAPFSAAYLFYSAPELVSGESYTLRAGADTVETAQAGTETTGGGGGMSGAQPWTGGGVPGRREEPPELPDGSQMPSSPNGGPEQVPAQNSGGAL